MKVPAFPRRMRSGSVPDEQTSVFIRFDVINLGQGLRVQLVASAFPPDSPGHPLQAERKNVPSLHKSRIKPTVSSSLLEPFGDASISLL